MNIQAENSLVESGVSRDIASIFCVKKKAKANGKVAKAKTSRVVSKRVVSEEPVVVPPTEDDGWLDYPQRRPCINTNAVIYYEDGWLHMTKKKSDKVVLTNEVVDGVDIRPTNPWNKSTAVSDTVVHVPSSVPTPVVPVAVTKVVSAGTCVHKGKRYDCVEVDGKKFMRQQRPRHSYLDSIGPSAVMNPHLAKDDARRYISDHVLVSGQSNGLEFGTFNVSMSTLALRQKQGLLNCDGSWKGFTTGQVLKEDTVRRNFVVDKIVSTLDRIDILLLQEIDRLASELLEYRGVTVIYSQEDGDCNRGGVAVATKRKNICFRQSADHALAIKDYWLNHKGEQKSKHVGMFVSAEVVREYTVDRFNIANFHLDAAAAKESIDSIVVGFAKIPNTYVGGDMNLDKTLVFSALQSIDTGFKDVTHLDTTRPYTIDAIFRNSCQSSEAEESSNSSGSDAREKLSGNKNRSGGKRKKSNKGGGKKKK